jgi:hypothetical protein
MRAPATIQDAIDAGAAAPLFELAPRFPEPLMTV